MEKHRCGWCKGDSLYEAYHDEEWGVPVKDDELLFEFLVLETFQAGLSWITILRRRENFRTAFDNFDYKKIAKYPETKILDLLQDEGIIRNKLKVRATVSNAQAYINVQKEFGTFSNYIWQFVEGVSVAISKDLKKRGFKFVGSTIIYAFMQATGMVNDHEIKCYRYHEV